MTDTVIFRKAHRSRVIGLLHTLQCTCATKCLVSIFGLKYDVTVVFLDPDFLKDACIPATSEHFRQKLA